MLAAILVQGILRRKKTGGRLNKYHSEIDLTRKQPSTQEEPLSGKEAKQQLVRWLRKKKEGIREIVDEPIFKRISSKKAIKKLTNLEAQLLVQLIDEVDDEEVIIYFIVLLED